MVHRAAQETGLDREPDADFLALHDNRFCLVQKRRLATRLGGQQLLRIRMLRALEDLVDRARLDDLTLGHDADAIGEFADDAEIVGDEQHGHAMLGLQAAEQFQDLRLDRDVERGGRFVGDQEFRPVGECHGDHDTLALPAREFVRICREPLFRFADADLMQQFQHPCTGRGACETLMERQDLADLPLDRVERIERGHRLLEDHGDRVAAHRAEFVLARCHQIPAVEENLARGVAGGRIRQKFQDRGSRDRLAGTGFADQSDDLATTDVEGNFVDRQALAAALVEGNGQIAHGEER